MGAKTRHTTDVTTLSNGGNIEMKTILSVLLAAAMLLTALAGCGRDTTGEARPAPGAASPSAAPTAGMDNTGDSAKDGIIDEGRDAVDGVVGAGEDAVDDLLEGGEELVDDAAGAVKDMVGGEKTADDRPQSSPSATAGH